MPFPPWLILLWLILFPAFWRTVILQWTLLGRCYDFYWPTTQTSSNWWIFHVFSMNLSNVYIILIHKWANKLLIFKVCCHLVVAAWDFSKVWFEPPARDVSLLQLLTTVKWTASAGALRFRVNYCFSESVFVCSFSRCACLLISFDYFVFWLWFFWAVQGGNRSLRHKNTNH